MYETIIEVANRPNMGLKGPAELEGLRLITKLIDGFHIMSFNNEAQTTEVFKHLEESPARETILMLNTISVIAHIYAQEIDELISLNSGIEPDFMNPLITVVDSDRTEGLENLLAVDISRVADVIKGQSTIMKTLFFIRMVLSFIPPKDV